MRATDPRPDDVFSVAGLSHLGRARAMSATHVESVLPALSFLLRRNSRGHLVTGAILTTVSLLTVGLSVAVP